MEEAEKTKKAKEEAKPLKRPMAKKLKTLTSRTFICLLIRHTRKAGKQRQENSLRQCSTNILIMNMLTMRVSG